MLWDGLQPLQTKNWWIPVTIKKFKLLKLLKRVNLPLWKVCETITGPPSPSYLALWPITYISHSEYAFILHKQFTQMNGLVCHCFQITLGQLRRHIIPVFYRILLINMPTCSFAKSLLKKPTRAGDATLLFKAWGWAMCSSVLYSSALKLFSKSETGISFNIASRPETLIFELIQSLIWTSSHGGSRLPRAQHNLPVQFNS